MLFLCGLLALQVLPEHLFVTARWRGTGRSFRGWLREAGDDGRWQVGLDQPGGGGDGQAAEPDAGGDGEGEFPESEGGLRHGLRLWLAMPH